MPSHLNFANYQANASNILNNFDASAVYNSATGAWNFKDNAGNSLIQATTSAITLNKATTVVGQITASAALISSTNGLAIVNSTASGTDKYAALGLSTASSTRWLMLSGQGLTDFGASYADAWLLLNASSTPVIAATQDGDVTIPESITLGGGTSPGTGLVRLAQSADTIANGIVIANAAATRNGGMYMDGTALTLRSNGINSITISDAGAVTVGPNSNYTAGDAARTVRLNQGTLTFRYPDSDSTAHSCGIASDYTFAFKSAWTSTGTTKIFKFEGISNEIASATQAGAWTFPVSIALGTAGTPTGYTPTALSVYQEGSFTATYSTSYFTVQQTATYYYVVVGKMVTLYIATVTGTSNATTAIGTGLPAHLIPARDQNVTVDYVGDNSASVGGGIVRIKATSGNMEWYRENYQAFTASGTKTLPAFTISYILN